MFAEQALAESEARFRALVTASADIVYRMSADFSELRALEGRLFVAASPSPNRTWIEDYVHPDDRQRARDAIADAIRRKGVFDIEYRVFRKDGSIGWAHSRAVPMFDPKGEIFEWIGMASDVTARKSAEEAFVNQRRMYEAILTNTPDLAYVWNLDHRFIYANEGLLRMWGRTWDDAIGKNCQELGYEPWHAAMHDREIDQVAATKLPLRGEVPFNGAFGRRIYDYLLVPVIGANGEVEAVAGTTRDVTERKQLEGSLLEADRRKDEFLATLAHELRNPLAPIRNAVELLKAKPTEDKVRIAREIIDRQVHHMVRLVDDLMDVSRITIGHVTLRNEQIDLRRVLDDALEAASPAIAAGKHRLEVDIPDDTPQVEGDPTRLSQIFQNLLDNAAKYTPEGGTITLRAQRRGELVAVSVRDNGIGLTNDVHPRIFELFTRVHPADRIKTSGLGIGLALAKKLIELHGGNIEVHSEGPGKGSEFTVTLPALAAAQAPKPVVAHLPPRAAADTRLRVLVVDDNRDAAESLGLLLEMESCTVLVAYDGIQALQAMDTFKPDVALLDIGMPGMDGYELARRIRARHDGNEVMLVALTGWGQAEDKKRAADFGFDEHLTKPVDPELLTRMLTQSRVAA